MEDENKLVVDATEEALDDVEKYIEDKLDAAGCTNKQKIQIRLAIEEIFVNIAMYAYSPGMGKAEVICEILDEEPIAVMIKFIDSGKQFNPLEKEDADTSGKMFIEREGGFGIHLVKNIMDVVEYEYIEGKNVLTVKKDLNIKKVS
ncbi:MAG: ATP-binding protein [Lachnospiraceae bacterium]|nr:ATP-binding protein [Lachnospiraceae bacterium]